MNVPPAENEGRSEAHVPPIGSFEEWRADSRDQWDLRWNSAVYVLMKRKCDSHQRTSTGDLSFWKDVAEIKEWGEAKAILAALRVSSGVIDTGEAE